MKIIDHLPAHRLQARLTLVLGILAFAAALPAQTLLGPTPYLSFADSPFNAGSFTYFHLETFEDGLFNTPGVSASTGSVIGPGSNTDSVDGDDGFIDGSGTNGLSYFGGGTVTFTFSAATLGSLPTNVGIVWTDGQNPTFEAFDALNNSLGTLLGTSADGSNFGTTAEDRFFGVSYAGGISTITIT
ncbi:MAG: hypothetical protein PSW75_08095, partial [bacterium]|nr:hypothetical protein [bacterium]